MCLQCGFENVQGWCSSEFHAAGAACEKERSPNPVDSRGDELFVVLAERSPGRSVCAAVVGHFNF